MTKDEKIAKLGKVITDRATVGLKFLVILQESQVFGYYLQYSSLVIYGDLQECF